MGITGLWISTPHSFHLLNYARVEAELQFRAVEVDTKLIPADTRDGGYHVAANRHEECPAGDKTAPRWPQLPLGSIIGGWALEDVPVAACMSDRNSSPRSKIVPSRV